MQITAPFLSFPFMAAAFLKENVTEKKACPHYGSICVIFSVSFLQVGKPPKGRTEKWLTVFFEKS